MGKLKLLIVYFQSTMLLAARHFADHLYTTTSGTIPIFIYAFPTRMGVLESNIVCASIGLGKRIQYEGCKQMHTA
jgi:hypothetical protein